MSEQPSTDPIEAMQQLTNIEADLAEVATAVAAAPIQDATTSMQVEEGADDALMQNAEQVESVLEQSIPPAPETKEVQMQDVPSDEVQVAVTATQTETETPSSVEINTSPLIVEPSSTAAVEAANAISAINADIANPVLPESVVSPAHDITMETQAEEASSSIIVETIDVVQPEQTEHSELNGQLAASSEISLTVPAAAATNGDLGGFDMANPSGIDFVSHAEAPKLPAQTPFASLQALKPEIALPEGLTGSSPSVTGNPELFSQWQADQHNPTVLLSLFNWAVQKTEIADARAWYAALAIEEPTAITPLLLIINLELSLSNFPQVEALFAKALNGPSGGITAAADVSIWKAYLHYIRRQNLVTDGASNADQVRNTVSQAYEYALKECGNDRESGEIWQEYISFLAEPSPKNTWDIQQQQDNLRKVYQRAVCIPLNNIEALWKAYDAFESNTNKLTAKKFLAEKSPAYMTARTALRELRNLTDALPHPILPQRRTFTEQDRQIVALWRAWLKWEESNPLVIEDQTVLAGRIAYALKKCLGEMRHFPEMWHYAAHWYAKNSKADEAAAVLRAGVEACSKSFLLNFALADAEEEHKNFATCHEIYDTLISHLQPEIDELKITVAAEVDAARGPEIPAPLDGTIDDEVASETARLIEEREARGRLVEERRGQDVDALATAASVVWIMYMRFARRAEGIKAARGIFGKARKSAHVTWHVFEASAMMEYHSNKDASVAIRIFELGWKLFAEEVEYVVRYLQFLLSINDDTNARALFERSALKIPADKARPLWDAWARYEYLYGDLSAVQKLETRFSEVFPNDSPLKRFAQRFTYNGIDEIALRDLGFGSRPRAPLPPLPPPTNMLPPPAFPSPIPKRPAPDSPRSPARRRPSIDRSRSPGPHRGGDGSFNKRYRQASSPPPPPPPRRFPPPERERDGPPRYTNAHPHPPPRARSPLPPPLPPIRREDRGPLPAPNMGPGPGQIERDRSGLPRPLARFIGNLPSTRAFDGPIFRPDDIMHLFSQIPPMGMGVGVGVGMGGPPPANNNIQPLPPMRAPGGYGERELML
ncbi:hypothetical protein BCR39DRAFT_519303 [Naematelia encephala]|uniref:mRNA 3'-end-processing protein RNA14 n=1 Tax=Naematelia encephala TaxID=71784 RepID=A0A1Y2BI79_9TREE|nr:hypothetical protein BCR39DRAFT_519303 [Naematelia encephala]